MLKIFLLTCIKLITAISIFPAFSYAASSLEAGLNYYQKGEYDKAREEFVSLSQSPQTKFAALYNLGNIAEKQKKPGLALAYYRLAQTISPRDKDLKFNTQFVSQEFNIRPMPGSISTFELFQQEILSRFTFMEFSFCTALCLFCFVIRFLKYLKNSYSSEPKDFPLSGILFLAGFTFLSASLMFFKLYDSYLDRATIVATRAEVRSGPGPQNASLVEIPEGSEVFIQKTATNETGTWKQVSIPGNLTGWVIESSLMQTSGEGPW